MMLVIPTVAMCRTGDALVLDEQGTIQTTVSYKSKNCVVMVFHPYCGFSLKAFSQIPEDVRKRMIEHGYFIVPTGSSLQEDIDAVRKWSATNSDIRPLLITDKSDWPEIEFDLVPSFFFFKDGKLIEKIKGWARDGSYLQTLTDDLDKIEN